MWSGLQVDITRGLNVIAIMVKLVTSYKFFLWFMRTVTIPIIVGCYYMARSSWDELVAISSSGALLPFSHMLSLLIGVFGGVFVLACFLVAWTCGWKVDKENEQ